MIVVRVLQGIALVAAGVAGAAIIVLLVLRSNPVAPRETARVSASESACKYLAHGALPDPACTPGAINHAVRQTTIRTTICIPGWTATIRPPETVTGPEKILAIRRYGFAFGSSPRGYEYDHLIPLELGGAPNDDRNLWPEPHPGSFAKDVVENRLHRAVCAGTLSLARARRAIRHDWRTAP